MLRKPPVHFLQYYRVLHYQGAWYIMRNSHLVQGTSPGVPIQPTPLLDYSTRAIHGTVVPQRRSPTDEVDVRRHVGRDLLQLPIFFVNHNGRHGFLLSDILRGCDRDLRNANNPAQLGPRTTTSIRIGVSLSPSSSVSDHDLTRFVKLPIVARLHALEAPDSHP